MENGANQPSTSGLTAIASCPTTLELSQSPLSSFLLLSEKLPLYDGQDIRSAKETEGGRYIHKQDLFDDLPLSDGELEHAWRELCAFESLKAVWRPKPSYLLKMWRAILSHIILRGLSPERSISRRAILNQVEEDGLSQDLFVAVIAWLGQDVLDSDNDGTFPQR